MNVVDFKLAVTSGADRVFDRVRSIPLRDLLAWQGFSLKREGISFRAKDDRYNIVIHGEKWFDNRAGVGGAGAIDLQMHLCGGDFRTTCQVLAEGFRPAVGGLAFPESRVRESFSTRRSFEELASQYAVPSESNWSIAHDYLVKTRGLDPDLIDPLHDRGLIYANNHRPNPSLVFLHRTTEDRSLQFLHLRGIGRPVCRADPEINPSGDSLRLEIYCPASQIRKRRSHAKARRYEGNREHFSQEQNPKT